MRKEVPSLDWICCKERGTVAIFEKYSTGSYDDKNGRYKAIDPNRRETRGVRERSRRQEQIYMPEMYSFF